jgi:hypothetical protein
MRLRAYEPDDYYQLTNLYKIPELYGGSYDESRDTPEKLQKVSLEDNLFVVIDEESGLLVGSAMFLRNAHSFWLTRFVLDDHHPGATLAGVMLSEFAEMIARNDGHESVIVYSSPKYEELEARYKKLKFKKSNDYTCFWKEVTHEI